MDKIINKIKNRLWFYIFLILIIPLILNFILLIPAFLPIVGNQTDWLRFWASYLGIIIAIIIPSTVCYFSLRENRTARMEQLEKERFNKFKQVCIKCTETYLIQNFSEVLFLSTDIPDLKKTLKEISKEGLNVHVNFLLTYADDIKHENKLQKLEYKCFNWYSELVGDCFTIINCTTLIREKAKLIQFLNIHNFHKTPDNLEFTVNSTFDKGDFILLLSILGCFIKKYQEESQCLKDFVTEVVNVFAIRAQFFKINIYGTEQDK